MELWKRTSLRQVLRRRPSRSPARNTRACWRDKRQKEWLLEQLRLARKKKFGSSSEQLTDEAYEQLSLLFDEPAAYKQPPEEEPEAEETVEVQAHSRKKRSGSAREILPENAEVEEETHELPEDAHLCPQCGEVMQPPNAWLTVPSCSSLRSSGRI